MVPLGWLAGCEDGALCCQVNAEDQTAKDLAVVMLETATLRSGYILPDSAGFADRIDRMLRLSMDISLDEAVSWGGHLFSRFQPHFLFLMLCINM